MERLFQDEKLDEAKEKVAALMGNVNLNLEDTLQKMSQNPKQEE